MQSSETPRSTDPSIRLRFLFGELAPVPRACSVLCPYGALPPQTQSLRAQRLHNIDARSARRGQH